MKYIEVVNAVLRRFREDAVVTSDDTEYAKLIRQFVHETKEDIENSWDWNRLRHSIVITTEAGEDKYVAHCVGERAKVIEALDATNGREIVFGAWAVQNRLSVFDDSAPGQPRYIDRNGFDTVGDTIYQVWPVPDRIYTIVLNAIIPQDGYQSIDLDDFLVEIPTGPLVLGTYLRAIEERGDDAASRYEFNLGMYERSLHQAIASDESQQEDANMWEVE